MMHKTQEMSDQDLHEGYLAPGVLPADIQFTLVIACYCEEPHLFRSVQALCQYLNLTKLNYELVFVEDASPDGTRGVLKECVGYLSKNNISYQTILHRKNKGRGRTVQDGIMVAHGPIVGFIDIDLEHSMDGLLSMILQVMYGGSDVVVAKRIVDKKGIHPMRTVVSAGCRWLVKALLKLPVSDSEAGLKIFRREKILGVLPELQDERWFWDTEIVAQSVEKNLKVTEHSIVFTRNSDKKSTVHLFRDSILHFYRLFFYWKNH